MEREELTMVPMVCLFPLNFWVPPIFFESFSQVGVGRVGLSTPVKAVSRDFINSHGPVDTPQTPRDPMTTPSWLEHLFNSREVSEN